MHGAYAAAIQLRKKLGRLSKERLRLRAASVALLHAVFVRVSFQRRCRRDLRASRRCRSPSWAISAADFRPHPSREER